MAKQQQQKTTNQIEYAEQCAVMTWAEIQKNKYPELELLKGDMGGIRLSIGAVMKCKRAGCIRRGWPDIHLPVSRGGHHSLFIELKKPVGGTVSQDQKAVHRKLEAEGNKVVVARGYQAAITALMDYLNLK